MWHLLDNVAENFRLNKVEFKEFAQDKCDKYKLIPVGDGFEVSTWFVDNLVKDFRASKNQGEKP